MKDEFVNLYNFMNKNIELSEWAGSRTLNDWTAELQNEINEMKVELEKQNWDDFKKEVGDVLWDLLHLIGAAEKQGITTMNELLQQTHEKFKFRKPFILENKPMSLQEESEFWPKIKALEKEKLHNE